MKRDYITTYTNKRFWLPEAEVEAISIYDIARALSHICRFAGHIDYFYSVAQHCINVSLILPPEFRLEGLLHDAGEAYLSDVATPFKRMLRDYGPLEDDIWQCVSKKYGVAPEMSDAVKWADRVMLMTERDILKPNSPTWGPEYESIQRADHNQLIFGERPFREIEKLFIEKFFEYGGVE